MANLLDLYPLPADVPSGEIDPKELERAKYLAMIRMGLGVAGREPLGSAVAGGFNTYAGAEQDAQKSMLAQLSAYKTRQEIGAKIQADAKQKALSDKLTSIYASAPITGPGGPTEANATIAAVQQYRQTAVQLMLAGKYEDAKRASDIADNMEGTYGPAVDVKTPDNQIRIARFNNKGGQLVSDLAPAKEAHFQDIGGAVGAYDPFTAAPIATIPKGQSWADKAAFGNLTVAQQRLQFEKDQAAGPAGAQPKAIFANENTMRDEFNRLSTPFITVRDAYRRVKSASESEPSGAGDIALLYGYMKVLDPGSTVREGEFATAQSSGGLPGWVVQKYNGLVNGERLSSDMRAHIVGQTESLYSKQEEAQKNTENEYRILAKRNGLNPQNVVPNYRIDAPKPPAPPSAPGAVPPEVLDAVRRAEEWKRSHPQ